MSNVQVFDNTEKLAEAVAQKTVDILKATVNKYSSAVWVLAGGSTPLPAYKVVAEKYARSLDWSRVTLVMGDERMSPPDGPDNSWRAIHKILDKLPTNNLIPNANQSAENAAAEYEVQISTLRKGDSGLPRFDVVWLGVGDDGHTLSLFPRHSSIMPSNNLVVAVHDSPKPPSDRISLTLRAMQGATNVMVIVTGTDKQAVVSEAVHGGHSPIALVASIVNTHDGHLTWFVDKSAAPTD